MALLSVDNPKGIALASAQVLDLLRAKCQHVVLKAWSISVLQKQNTQMPAQLVKFFVFQLMYCSFSFSSSEKCLCLGGEPPTPAGGRQL